MEDLWRGLGLLALLTLGGAAGAAEGLLAHWDFTEGSGGVLHDRVGGCDGKIINAVWVKTPRGNALRFDGIGDCVELSEDLPARLTQDFTVLVWFRLQASPFPNTTTNYTVLDCETYQASGFHLRIDGSSGKPYFRTSFAGNSTGNFATRDVRNEQEQCLVVTRDAKAGIGRFYLDGVFAGETPLKPFAPPTEPLRISNVGQSFQGELRDLRLYDRCFSPAEVLAAYQSEAGGVGPAAWRGKLRLTPFVYPAERELVARVNALGVLPLATGDEVVLELAPVGGAPVQTQTIKELPPSAEVELTLDLGKLGPGRHELRAVQRRGPRTVTQTVVAVAYPPTAPVVPAPAQGTVAVLPPVLPPPAYTLTQTPEGGLNLRVGDAELAVEALLSYPHGGDNALPAGLKPGAEPQWRVITGGDGPLDLRAEGQSYRLVRHVQREAHRVVITQTLTNKSAEPLGIILSHGVRLRAGQFAGARLGGNGALGAVADLKLQNNPTVFMSRPGLGVGLVALDDVGIVQARGSYDGTGGNLASKSFALDAGASYTLEWAIYLNASGDYYDFINAVRRDEGRNGVTIEGGFSFHARGVVPEPEFVASRNLKYLSGPSMSGAPDDPGVSIEGVEFVNFPKVCQIIKDTAAECRQRYPGVHLMFHIAHSLYATDKPDQLFPDARVLRPDGTQVVYGYNYEGSGHFSPQRLAENWRWWIFYPTLTNSFLPAMMKSVDVMMDDMGLDGAFLDGYMAGYGDEFTYDRWDGHTAEIDPATKLIVRRPGNVLLLSQEAMAAYTKRIMDKGGVVVANNVVVTRTIGKLPIIVDNEINEGPNVHLARTTACLGNTASAQSEADVHTDILNKLRWANLYFFYGGDQYIKHRMAPARMFPITLRELHEGRIVGDERLITSQPGVVGWPDDPARRDLHQVYLFDSRGREVPARFLTTADTRGVRTRLELNEREIAIVRRVPLTVTGPGPVNVLVTRVEADRVDLRVNARGQLRFTLRTGDFAVKPGMRLVLATPERREVVADATGQVTFTVSAAGPLQISLTAAKP